MSKHPSDPPKILFLFSDTGGGHRSATEAIIEALNICYHGQFEYEMIDIFKEYAPIPLNFMPDLYPKMVKIPQAWKMGYYLSDGKRRTQLITASSWPYIRNAIRAMVRHHPCDVIVSLHPLGVAPTLRALGHNRPPFVTIVTDLVTAHSFWYHPNTDLCIVPTEAASQRAQKVGLKPEQIQVVGLPVAYRFCQPKEEKSILRQQLGWPVDLPLILLVGGGEGMGPLERTAQTIAGLGVPLSLVVIAGRNEKLRKKLEAYSWPVKTVIYGFVQQMPEFMQAADVLVTKAGPGTISEALNAGLPMILYSRLPGQEDGNVSYVVTEGAGVWAPHPDQIAQALKLWLSNPKKLEAAIKACKTIARPDASIKIAQILGYMVGLDSPGLMDQPSTINNK